MTCQQRRAHSRGRKRSRARLSILAPNPGDFSTSSCPSCAGVCAAALGDASLTDALRRTGMLYITPNHVDLVMRMKQVSVPVRIAGLDANPGWTPELGRIIKFHFVNDFEGWLPGEARRWMVRRIEAGPPSLMCHVIRAGPPWSVVLRGGVSVIYYLRSQATRGGATSWKRCCGSTRFWPLTSPRFAAGCRRTWTGSSRWYGCASGFLSGSRALRACCRWSRCARRWVFLTLARWRFFSRAWWRSRRSSAPSSRQCRIRARGIASRSASWGRSFKTKRRRRCGPLLVLW